MAIPPVSLVTLFEDNTRGGLVCKQELKNTFISYIINISHTQIDNICELVIECQSKLLIKNLEKKDNDDLRQGFLIHEWSLNSLKKLLSSSGSLLICIIDDKKNKLAGYLLLTSVNNFIEHMNPELGKFELDENVITDKQWKQFISSSDVRYIEQTGVALEYHRLGVGDSLIALAKKQSTESICTLVMFWPYDNTASANLKTKNGFQPIGIWNQIICPEFVPFKARIFIWLSAQSAQL